MREVLADSAAQGARIAALDGASAELARERTAELITTTLPAEYADNITVYYSHGTAYVAVSAPAPLIGLVSPARIEVLGSAPVE